MNKIYFSISILMLFNSCVNINEETHEMFKGTWFIKEIKYDTIDYKNYLLTNLFLFKENSKISVPNSLHFEEKDLNAKWSFEIIGKDILLNLKSKNLMFNGVYNVRFFNEEGLKGMEIRTDTVYIKAYKSEDIRIPR
jgi:hypothetical protein